MGPLCHWACIKEVRELLRKVEGYPSLDIGGIISNIEPDLRGPSHGYDVKKGSGSLMKYIREYSRLLRLDDPSYAKNVRWLTHYILDGMSIGQICGKEFWGRKDDLIDLAGEGVCCKRKWRSYLYDFGDFDEAVDRVEESIRSTYQLYYDDAKKWLRKGFVFPWEVTNHVRRGIAQASSLAASFVVLANRG